MPIPRRKACLPCAASKRRCDRQLPECQRCLARDVDCLYPQPKRRQRDAMSGLLLQAGPSLLPTHQDHTDAPAVHFGDWATPGDGLDISLLSDTTMPYDLAPKEAFSAFLLGSPAQGLSLERTNYSSNAMGAWFLQDETWVKERCSSQEPQPAAIVKLEPFIRAVREMLESWVKNGHNSFIHQKLYERSMAPCLQDAFTTLAAYSSCTLAVKEMVLQVAEDRSSALVCQNPFATTTGGGAPAVRTDLAYVQSLFIYIFIRLFDGSLRMRVSAERQLPTLRQWLVRLLDTVQQYGNEYCTSGNYPLPQTVTGKFDTRSYEASTELWSLWILTECVRRSHIVIETVANAYDCMIRGWAECTGTVMFTARCGLWEAGSATKWLELSRVETPLLVSSLRPESFLSQHAAGEADDFAKVVWACAIGADKIQSWIDGTTAASRL